MALSAFGDPIHDDSPAAGPAAVKPPAPQAPHVSAFGDSFDDEAPAKPVPSAQPPKSGDLDPMQLYYGAARRVDQGGLAIGRVLGIPAAQTFDAARGLFTDEDPYMAQNALREHVLDPLQRRADSLVPSADASFGNKMLNAGGGLGGDLLMMLATGGLSRVAPALPAVAPTSALPGVAGQLGQAARTMAVPASTNAINTGHDVTAETGSVPEGLKAAIASGAGDIAMGLLPASLPGNLAMRVATGAPIGAVTGEMSRQLRNAAVPTGMQTPFNVEDAMVNAAMGGVVGGVMGRTPEPRFPQSAPEQTPQVDPRITAARTAVPDAIRQYLNPEQPTPQPTQSVPYGGSRDISPLLDNLQLDGERRAKALDLMRPVEGDVEVLRRGVVTEAEQTRLANLIGLDGAQALAHGRKLGQTFNAEEFRAVTSAVQNQMASVLDLQQRIVSGQATDADRVQFMDNLANMRRTTGELLGARAEAGRALAAQRRQVVDLKQAQAILESTGGRDNADDLATALGEAIRSGGLQNAARVIHKGNHITDYIKAGWLYDPTTHIANMAGNAGMVGVNVMDRTNAAILAGAKRMFGLKGETVWSEPVALLSGAIRGQAKALAATGKAFTQGESPLLGSGKLEESRLPQRSMPGALGTAKLVFDNTALLPFRALGAEDAYFAVTGYEAELRAQAHRIAAEERRTGTLPQGTKFSSRIEQLVASPTPSMIETAGDMARESTFNGKAGPLVSKVLAAKAALPWLNILIPFIKTPSAVVKRALKSSPAGVLAPSTWREIAAGGAKSEMAIARMMTGTQIMIGAGLLAQAGFLTGAGPSDEKERKAWLAAGNQPYSIKHDGQWYGINRLDPFAMWAAVASDVALMDWKNNSAEDSALQLAASFANNVANKTWFSGIQRLSMALADPQRYLPSFAQQTAASVIQPNALVSNIASRQDPYARQPDSLMGTLANRVPGLRESLPARQDAWGQPQANTRHADNLFDALVPMTRSKEATDPVRREAARLQWTPGDMGDHFTVPSRTNGVKGTRYNMDADQHREILELVGQRIHAQATQLMRTRQWGQMDDDQRRAALSKITRKARNAAKSAFVPYLSNGQRGLVGLYRKQTAAMARTEVTKR